MTCGATSELQKNSATKPCRSIDPLYKKTIMHATVTHAHAKDNLASHCYQKILCYHFLLTTCAGWTRIGSKPKRKRLKEGDDDRNIICVDALLPSPALSAPVLTYRSPSMPLDLPYVRGNC
jgi:hypothetical protein